MHDRLTVRLTAICEVDEGTRAPYFCTIILISLSTHGAGFIAPRAFERHTLLRLELSNSTNSVWRKRIARVVHCRPVGEANAIVGCQFTEPLTPAELTEIVS